MAGGAPALQVAPDETVWSRRRDCAIAGARQSSGVPRVSFPLSPPIRRASARTVRSVCCFFFLLCAVANAGDLVVKVTEVATGHASFFRVETATLEYTDAPPVEGRAVEQISRYTVQDHQLVANRTILTDADEILFQCTKDGADFVIVRFEQDAPSSILGSFLAGLGMYRPVSKVFIVKVVDGKYVARKRLVRNTDSFDWKAIVLDAAASPN
jgi:hypothetical protein